MDEQEKALEEIMRRHEDIPPMRSNLSERIIDAAQSAPQQSAKRGFALPSLLNNASEWMTRFVQNTLMPRPAMVMAGVLVFGLAVGVFMNDVTEVPEEDLIFLYVENSFLFEDWL